MTEPFGVVWALFAVSQAIGILMGVIVAVVTIAYVTLKTLWDGHFR